MKKRLLFNMFNHNELGQRSLEDVIGIFGHQCRALGWEAIWEKKNQNFLMAHEGLNVIVEGFVPSHGRIFQEAYERGARFIMMATEEPTDRGFNHGTQKEMTERQRDFPHAAKWFEAILYLVPGEYTHNFYNQFAPARYLELGYAPTLERKFNFEPDYDFGFYGSLTDRRLRILKKLANRIKTKNAVKIVADFKTQEDRDRQMARAKVVVQLRKFDKMGLVSSSRCNTALHLGRPIVAEPHDLSKPWDEVVRFTDTIEGFLDTCMLVRGAWRGVWAQQFDRFRTKFSPQLCVGKPFDELGINALLDGAPTRQIAA